MRHGMVIELIGVSGAGKSSIASLLTERLRGMGLAVQRIENSLKVRPRRPSARKYGYARGSIVLLRWKWSVCKYLVLRSIPWFLLFTPTVAWTTLRAYLTDLKAADPHDRRLVDFRECWMVLRARGLDALCLWYWGSRPGVHLFEEGVFAELWAVFLRYRPTQDKSTLIEWCVKRTRVPTIMLFVHVREASTVAMRLQTRSKRGPYSRLLLARPHMYQQYLADVRQGAKVAQEAAKARDDLWFIEVDNNPEDDLRHIAAGLADQIMTCVGKLDRTSSGHAGTVRLQDL